MRIIKGVVDMHGQGQRRLTRFRVVWMGRQVPGQLAAGPSRGTRVLNNLRIRHLNPLARCHGQSVIRLSYMLRMGLLVQLGGQLELALVPKVGSRTRGRILDLQSRFEGLGHVRHRRSLVAVKSQ